MKFLQELARAAMLLAALLATGTFAQAATYSEGVDGDLSDTAGTPTPFALDPGANTLVATSGSGDFDLVAFTVPTGHQLDSIILSSYGGASQSFTGIEAGGTWNTGLGGAVDPSGLAGWSHFGPASSVAVGTDMLDNIATGAGSLMASAPYGAGTYTQLFQDTGGAVSFSVTYNVSAVPEPSTGALLLVAGGMAALFRWHRRRRRAV